MSANFKFFFVLFLLVHLNSLGQDVYFQSDPTLSPDGKTIVFSYDGDLWRVSAAGGEALRITAMDGEENLPRISPDGKWIAFTATQYGNKDVYVMPMAGGQIKQLTFHDAADEVDSWSWDAKHIYFTSARHNIFGGYKIAVKGGTPIQLYDHYFINAHNLAEHPESGELFFNETWESKRFTHRKRYKGDYNPDIKSYNPRTKTYKEYTTYKGKDMWATLDKKGKLYFASDELNGEYNLYTFKNNQKTALTKFTTSIGRPQVSANGQKVVFTKDYQLFMYDVASQKSKKVAIKITANNTLKKEQDFKVKDNITYFDVSSDTKKIAFVSRGELFVSDIKGKYVKKLSTTPNERVKEVKWLKDNRTLLFNQTANGYTNLYTISADGSGQEKRLTNEAENHININLGPKLEQAAYISGRDELRLMNLSTFKSTAVVTDEFWALYAGPVRFSPDGKYLLYNAYRNFEKDIFVYHIPTKRITNLSNSGVSEANPVWSADGKYIYFEANLTSPVFPRGNRDADIYRIALDKVEAPFRADKFNDLFKAEEKEDGKKGDKKAEKPALKIVINKDRLMERIDRIGPAFGLQGGTFLITKGETNYVYYYSNHDEGTYQLWRTVIKPFEKNKTEKAGGAKVRNFQIKSVKDKHYIRYNGAIHTIDLSKNKHTKIAIDATFRKNLSNEFAQMFFEAWAGFESNFYDENFHGENWEALRDKYAAFLPYVTRRSQLRLIFNDMLGELNTSHFGFSSNGKEENEYYGSKTSATGIIFSKNKPYVVDYILAKSPADVSGKNIKAGDRLVSVNGQPVNEANNREMYFSKPSVDKEMQLVFKRGNQKITTNIHPTTSTNLKRLLYDKWVDANQAYVDAKSNNRIAYVHMKNMSSGALYNFKREMVSEAYNKDALILDLRYNRGGNVHDEVLQFLSQKPYAQWKYREGKLTSQPNFTPASKPIIVLVNEQSLSDAEVTSAGFKELGLGKIVGTETYRWIIFTSGARLVDGSFYRLPSWGCYSLNGENLEKTGVTPDVYVKETFKDRLNGNQLQLDKSIDLILKDLK